MNQVVQDAKTSAIQDKPSDLLECCHCLFDQPWYLEALAPGKWSAAEVVRSGTVVARMPYMVTKKYGIRTVYKPKLTQTLLRREASESLHFVQLG